MTQAQVAPTGLVRVTVASGTRRMDLVLPGSVPVAELVPELARSVGMLDPQTAYAGYRIVLADGRKLAGDLGLIPQGVEDGGVLTVSAGIDDKPPRVYDDVVEAMTDVVESEMAPWKPEAGRRTSLLAAALLLLLGAGALWTQAPSMLAGVAAAVIGIVLAGGAIVLSRLEAENDAAIAAVWIGEIYGGVAGFLIGSAAFGQGDGVGVPLAIAGAGAMLASAIGFLGLGESRILAMPGALVGGVFLVAGLLLSATGWSAGVVLGIVLVVVVLAGSFFPWLALSTTKTDVPQLYSDEDINLDPDEIREDQVRVDAKVAHEILVAIALSVGVLVVLTTPFVVQLGLAGTLVALAACVVLMLRTRQYRTGSEVLVGLSSGIAGLLAIGAALLVFHEAWRPTTAVVLAAAGGVLLVLTLVPDVGSIRRGRLADVAETTCLLAMLPLMVLASGLFSAAVAGF